MSLTIEWRDVSGVAVLDLTGESSIMDGTILQQTVAALTREGKRQFILNLEKVRHLDSFGLGQLVATLQTVRKNEGDLRIVNPGSTVRDLLRYTRIDSVVKVSPSEAEAVQELQSPKSS